MGGEDQTYLFDLARPGEGLSEGDAIDSDTAKSLDGRTAELVGAGAGTLLLKVQFEVGALSQQAADLGQINCDDPRWSPTAQEVSLACETPSGDATVYIVRNLGWGMSGEDHEVSEVAGDSPTWSPDGSKLAYISEADGDGNLMVAEWNGETLSAGESLVEQPGSAVLGAWWSPFVTFETGSFVASDVILDFYPPTLTAPGDIVVEATGAKGISRDDELIFTIYLAQVEASDLVDGALEECEDESVHTGCWWHDIPETLPVGMRTVTFYAADNAGNEAGPVTADIEVKPRVEVPRAEEPESVFVAEWGTKGARDGQFNFPTGVAVSPDGKFVYVADTWNHRIQKFTSAGRGLTVFISKWDSWDKDDEQFKDSSPWGIAVSPDGKFVYVADSENDRIQKFDSEGRFLRKWGGSGYLASKDDGEFNSPRGVAVSPDGKFVYVADTFNDRIQKFTSGGDFVSNWGTKGARDGQFNWPHGVAVSPDGKFVYVADTLNDRIQKFTSGGDFVSTWGTDGKEDGEFHEPYGVAVASDGSVYVADTDNDRVQKFDSRGDFVSKWGSFGKGNEQFKDPIGVAASPDGQFVYVADSENDRIQKLFIAD